MANPCSQVPTRLTYTLKDILPPSTKIRPTPISCTDFLTHRKTRTLSPEMNPTTAQPCPMTFIKPPPTVLAQAQIRSYPSRPPQPSQGHQMLPLPTRPAPLTTRSLLPPIPTPHQLIPIAPYPIQLLFRILSYPHTMIKPIPTKVSFARLILRRRLTGGKGGATQAKATPPHPSKVTRHFLRSTDWTGQGRAHHLRRVDDGLPACFHQ